MEGKFAHIIESQARKDDIVAFIESENTWLPRYMLSKRVYSLEFIKSLTKYHYQIVSLLTFSSYVNFL